MMQITERHNPAAVAWRAVRDGAEWEVCWLRGTTGFFTAFRRDDRTWSTSIGMDQDRWRCDGTLTSARAVAREFFTTTAHKENQQ